MRRTLLFMVWGGLLLVSCTSKSVPTSGLNSTPNTTASRGNVASALGSFVAWAYDGDSHQIVPIGLPSGKIGTPIRLPDAAISLAVSSDGQTGYATLVSGSGSDARWALGIIDFSTGHLEETIPLPQIGSGGTVAVSPDGRTAYVGGDQGLYPVDLSQRRVRSPIPVPCGPCGDVAISADGSTAYVVSGTHDEITPIDLSSLTADAPISLPQSSLGSVVLSPDGHRAYISSPSQGVYVTPLGASGGSSQLVGVNGTTFVIIDLKNATAYAVGSFPGTLTPIDPTSLSPGNPIDLGIQVMRAAITPDGTTAVAVGGPGNPSNGPAYVVVNLSTGSVQHFTPPPGTFAAPILGVAVGPTSAVLVPNTTPTTAPLVTTSPVPPISDFDLTIFLQLDASVSEIQAIRQELSVDPEVKSFIYVDETDAAEEYRSEYHQTPGTDLPTSYRIRLQPNVDKSKFIQKYESQPGVRIVHSG